MRYLSRVIALSTALCMLVLVSATVHATSPGENGLISFRRYFNDKHTSGALFVVNPDGSHETQITFPAPNELDYTQNWSPDGRQLAFERVTFTPESETHEIWVVNVDGSNPHRLVTCPGDDVCGAALLPSWSPDGQWIAFSRVSFTSSSFSPDGNGMTIGVYPGVGRKGNADVWIGHFDDHMRIDGFKPLTRTNRWESSPRWGTAPLLE
jgi:Tol biopolymer transport system component